MSAININSSKTKLIAKAVLFCILFTTLFWAFSFGKQMFPEKWERLTHGVIGTCAALITTFIFLNTDKLTFAVIGLTFGRKTIKNFFTGLLSGLLIMGLVTAIVIITSGFKTEMNTNSSLLHFMLLSLPLVILAYMEELAFRGYPLEVLKNKIGIRNSLLITALLFAAYHIANGWSIQRSLLGPGPWGIIFGLAAVYSKGIAMPTGLHYGANLTTAAFAVDDSSFNLFVLKQNNGGTLENYQSSAMQILLPQMGILVFAVVMMELYLRNKKGL